MLRSYELGVGMSTPQPLEQLTTAAGGASECSTTLPWLPPYPAPELLCSNHILSSC
jgi:hypothetical protein